MLKSREINLANYQSMRERNETFKENEINLEDQDLIEKISWENLTFIEYEKNRTGPGENNLFFVLTDPADIAKNEELFKQEGFYVVVSDKISVDRALPDKRPKPCSSKKYLRRLPTVSVIVTFHNEVWSVLLRCVHSILNRSPKGLLREIILINDKSTFPELYEPLQNYFNGTFDSKVKIHNNGERQGLIKARMTGAKLAKGGAIIFLDSHMEVTNSWLPPLLEPLVYHPTYATVPVVDGINYELFNYEHSSKLWRGTFDWSFRYTWLPFKKKNLPKIGENFEISSMTGGAYAIRRQHFFHLGGYDEQLQIYNGENYEISLKLWLCGGGIIQVPCSRVAHLNKMFSPYRRTADNKTNFVGRNLKRITEVWLDDYKKYVYRIYPKRYSQVDAGDLTKQFELKKKLNCKPFKYFLDVVAPEMLERFPIVPKYFASGSIQNQFFKKCLGVQKNKLDLPIILLNCSDDLMNPIFGSNFTLTYDKSIGYNNSYEHCLSVDGLNIIYCHYLGGNQHFVFNITTRQIFNPSTNQCLSADQWNDEAVLLAECNESSLLQKWKWGFEDLEALNNWDNTGINFSLYDI